MFKISKLLSRFCIISLLFFVAIPIESGGNQFQSPSVSQKSKQVESRSSAINEYFRGGNENVGALSCGLILYERNVDSGTKDYIRNRDGNKCVICSSRVKLEVDHRRALMNGGTNDISNLFTLCDECHTEKTRMDNSLKRKRNKICNHL